MPKLAPKAHLCAEAFSEGTPRVAEAFSEGTPCVAEAFSEGTPRVAEALAKAQRHKVSTEHQRAPGFFGAGSIKRNLKITIMIKIIDHPDSNLIETISSGKLDKEDYEKLRPLLEKNFRQWGKIRWMFVMKVG